LEAIARACKKPLQPLQAGLQRLGVRAKVGGAGVLQIRFDKSGESNDIVRYAKCGLSARGRLEAI
jgi:hypothetical protein